MVAIDVPTLFRENCNDFQLLFRRLSRDRPPVWQRGLELPGRTMAGIAENEWKRSIAQSARLLKSRDGARLCPSLRSSRIAIVLTLIYMSSHLSVDSDCFTNPYGRTRYPLENERRLMCRGTIRIMKQAVQFSLMFVRLIYSFTNFFGLGTTRIVIGTRKNKRGALRRPATRLQAR